MSKGEKVHLCSYYSVRQKSKQHPNSLESRGTSGADAGPAALQVSFLRTPCAPSSFTPLVLLKQPAPGLCHAA